VSDSPAHSEGAPVIEVEDLTITFPGRSGGVARAVDGVNLAINRGEIVALVGESGCGKTTLARSILGLEKPTNGEVRFNGEPLQYGNRHLKKYRKNVQLVLQDPTGALNPRHSVYEAVAEGPRMHRMDDEPGRVSRALTQAGMRPPERFFLRYPYELSGGQRQRVVIAGALALEPQVIIADEPVSSLDASVRGEILALMLKLREELGLTLLVVTHDLGLAWNIADRIVVMYLGRVVEEGTTEQVLSDPQHPYTKALLSVVPEMEQVEAIVLTGETPDPTKIPAGCRFNPRCQEVKNGVAEAAGVLELCRTKSPEILPPDASQHVAACHLVASQLSKVSG
jgi:oligopeptide/dipeptide ABC transporter ATP-binding protein